MEPQDQLCMFVQTTVVLYSMTAFRFLCLSHLLTVQVAHQGEDVDDLSKNFRHAVQIWQMSEHIYEDEWKAEARQR